MKNVLATTTLLLCHQAQVGAFMNFPVQTTLLQWYNLLDNNHHDLSDGITLKTNSDERRDFIKSVVCVGLATSIPKAAHADAALSATTTLSPPVQVIASGDAKKLFNEGRALEAQGNILAAQRLYIKVTKISPR